MATLFISKCKMPISVNRIGVRARKLLASGTSPLIQYNGVLPQPASNSRQPAHISPARARIAWPAIAFEE
jgi:hypothetical protein